MEAWFRSVFDTAGTATLPVGKFLLCVGVSLAIGAFLALMYSRRNLYTKSYLLSVGFLPAVVCVIIMMVNGNIGAGVAVAGAFGLVRFRSAPGTAKEIIFLFLAMATGLVTGMGYLAYGVLFALLLGVFFFLCSFVSFPKKGGREKILRVTIPEDLDYTGVFDDIFGQYASKTNLVSVKTSNMGSMFKLTYVITEKDPADEKKMIDAIRERNGNLEISLSEQEVNREEL